jgi:integrase
MPASTHAVRYASSSVSPSALRAEQATLSRREHHWHPHQLRHNVATRLRKDFGIDVAQVVLGHKTLSVTQVYAEKDVESAQKVMMQAG